MAEAHPIRLASYNIRKCVGLDRRRRPGRILNVLNTLDADVIALQEADRRLGARPAALSAQAITTHTDYCPVETGADGPSLGWHGNAILLRRGLLAQNVRRIDLPGTEPRGALVAEIVPDGATPTPPSACLRLVGTHLGLLRRDRQKQIEALLQLLLAPSAKGADPCNSLENTAILGDFNEWSQKHGLEMLETAFEVVRPGASYHAARPIARLDRIALGSGLKLLRAGVCRGPVARIASDHLPIWADVAHAPAAKAH